MIIEAGRYLVDVVNVRLPECAIGEEIAEAKGQGIYRTPHLTYKVLHRVTYQSNNRLIVANSCMDPYLV